MRFEVSTGIQYIGNRLEGVLEDAIVRAFEMWFLPVELPVSFLFRHREESDTERTQVDGGHLGPQHLEVRICPAPAGAGRKDCVAALLDGGERLLEEPDVVGRSPGLGVTNVNMDNRRPGLASGHRLVGKLLRGDGKVWAHARRMHGSRDRRGDDDLVHVNGSSGSWESRRRMTAHGDALRQRRRGSSRPSEARVSACDSPDQAKSPVVTFQ